LDIVWLLDLGYWFLKISKKSYILVHKIGEELIKKKSRFLEKSVMTDENEKKSIIPAILAVVIFIITIAYFTYSTYYVSDTDDNESKKDKLPDENNIHAQAAYNLIQNNLNNSNFVILDVRTLSEFEGGHIRNATNLDFYSEIFVEELNNLEKNQIYLVYCRTGSRSAEAADIMITLGFGEVYNMLGGIVDWKAEGYETVSG
jgi:rhodanese-related sulfurtransferase